MSNKAILLATIVIVAISSILLVENIGTQPAEAGSDANCPAKSGGAATTIDPNAPNAVNTGSQPLPSQPTV
jgi:hypothetical protein